MEFPLTLIAGFVILILIDFKSNTRIKNKLKNQNGKPRRN